MTDAERTLLLAVARALAADSRIDWRLIAAVTERPWRERQAEDVARGRMIAAATE